MLCEHKAQSGNYCTQCGADLKLNKKEAAARDEFLPRFSKIMAKLNPELEESEIVRYHLDEFLRKNAMLLFKGSIKEAASLKMNIIRTGK
jgi:hypothetical protein